MQAGTRGMREESSIACVIFFSLILRFLSSTVVRTDEMSRTINNYYRLTRVIIVDVVDGLSKFDTSFPFVFVHPVLAI